jgi:hypothetical protein
MDYNINLWSTCIGTGFAVLVLDQLNAQRALHQLKKQLIREMSSSDNGLALRVLGELWDHDWVKDGSLQRAFLESQILNERY